MDKLSEFYYANSRENYRDVQIFIYYKLQLHR